MTTAMNMRCPSCSGPLRPAVLVCDPCEIRVEGTFAQNEFASLGADELHLLRIFVHCEGRIRDMESALGVSYPTIKARLADLRKKVSPEPRPAAPPPVAAPAERESFAELLTQLEQGRITYQEMMERIKRL